MITARVLAVVNEERTIHGLRYNDYPRYRKHCARKVHRLRQALKITHGKGKDFKKPPLVAPENLKDGHILLLLHEAERAWTYAQELLNENVKAQEGSIRHHALSRYRKAVDWAFKLRERSTSLYLSSQISSVSYAEIIVYHLLVHGRFLRTKDDFASAIKELSVCRYILDRLTASAASSREQALFTVFTDTIDPEIRYCAHEMGRTKAYDIAGIVADLAPKNLEALVPGGKDILDAVKALSASSSESGTGKKLEPAVWEGKPVPIRSPELVDAFLKIQKAVTTLEGKRKEGGGGADAGTRQTSRRQVTAFDGVLSALSDAEDLAKKLTESQQGTASSTSAGPGSRDAHFVHAYILYQLLARRIQRDLLIVNGLLQPSPLAPGAKPSSENQMPDPRVYPAVVKTLDTVLQSLDQMRALSLVDESPDISSALDVRVSFTKARRCNYLSLAHAAVRNYPQSIALIQRGQLHLREAVTFPSSSSSFLPELFFYRLDSSKVDIPELSATFDSDLLTFKKEWFAHNGGSVETDAKKVKKPLFFDVAFNYIEPPMMELQRRAGKEPPPPVPQQQFNTAAARGGARKVDVEEKEDTEEKNTTGGGVAGPAAATASSGVLSGLLGSWWGRN